MAFVELLLGCGGSAYEYPETGGAATVSEPASYGGHMRAETAAAPPPMMDSPESMPASADMGVGGGGGGEYDAWDGWTSDDAPARQAEPTSRPQMAQAQPNTGGGQTAGQTQAQQETRQQATDAVDLSQPLLIYTAAIHLGVYEVEATQETILGAVREAEGFLAQRSDNMLVVRVPAPRFQQVLDAIEGAGDVLQRNVEVLDVSEEYRDIAIRIRNAEAMRERLEQLLRNANDVQEALAVERELQRITESIETMKGRLRFLSDRIAFSTITIHFRPLTAGEQIDPDPFRLPFGWLDRLGLSSLLSL